MFLSDFNLLFELVYMYYVIRVDQKCHQSLAIFSDHRARLVHDRLHPGRRHRHEVLDQAVHLALPEDGHRRFRRHPVVAADLKKSLLVCFSRKNCSIRFQWSPLMSELRRSC